MNSKLTKSNIKGKEDVVISISPSDNLEREFFNALFSGDVIFQKVAGSPMEEILIIKKDDSKTIIIDDLKKHYAKDTLETVP